MSACSTAHETIVVRRRYHAMAARVFAAWREPDALRRWYMPGDETWSCRVVEHDFRVRGTKRLEFGPRDGERYTEDCRYEDIVDDRRLCFSMTISRDATRITTSMVTVELSEQRGATDLVVTDQLVILDGGDEAGARERGWGETLDKLTTELQRTG